MACTLELLNWGRCMGIYGVGDMLTVVCAVIVVVDV